MSSQREDIKSNLIDALKSISKVREVSTKFRTIAQVDSSKMPYIQVLSVAEDRERADSNKNSDCTWELSIWCYVQDEDDIETWIENIRAKVYADRTRGNNSRDCWIPRIDTDHVIVGQSVRGLILITLNIEHRVRDE